MVPKQDQLMDKEPKETVCRLTNMISNWNTLARMHARSLSHVNIIICISGYGAQAGLANGQGTKGNGL